MIDKTKHSVTCDRQGCNHSMHWPGVHASDTDVREFIILSGWLMQSGVKIMLHKQVVSEVEGERQYCCFECLAKQAKMELYFAERMN